MSRLYTTVPDEFLAALRGCPEDVTTRLVLADFVDERPDDYPPETGDAWRWTVEVGACPVLLTPAIIEKETRGSSAWANDYINHWNWMGSEWNGPQTLSSAMRLIPKPNASDDPAELFDALVKKYLDTDACGRSRIVWRPNRY